MRERHRSLSWGGGQNLFMTGAELKTKREKLGLSQSEFAELLPVNLRTLQDWESDRRPSLPPPYFYRALRDLEVEVKRKR
jgi:transcriptional regulator with XRE-family HTH domain